MPRKAILASFFFFFFMSSYHTILKLFLCYLCNLKKRKKDDKIVFLFPNLSLFWFPFKIIEEFYSPILSNHAILVPKFRIGRLIVIKKY